MLSRTYLTVLLDLSIIREDGFGDDAADARRRRATRKYDLYRNKSKQHGRQIEPPQNSPMATPARDNFRSGLARIDSDVSAAEIPNADYRSENRTELLSPKLGNSAADKKTDSQALFAANVVRIAPHATLRRTGSGGNNE
jgi:hypothetical protein